MKILIVYDSINGLQGVQVAAFDTRLTQSNINKIPVLAFFVRLWGCAAQWARQISAKAK